MMTIKAIQPRDYPTYIKENQCSVKIQYLGINVPLTNRWNVRNESRHQVGWNSYYMFENQCNQSDAPGWEVRLMLFNAIVVQVLFYAMGVRGGTIVLVH